jgi:hypothetical protein
VDYLRGLAVLLSGPVSATTPTAAHSSLRGMINFLSSASIVFLGLLWIRLIASGLWKVYRAFSLYIFALLVESGLLLAIVRYPPMYRKVWVVSRLTILLLEVVVVLSIFGRWTASYPGIGAFGRRLVILLMAISIGLAASTLPVAWSVGPWSVALQLTAIVNRGINLCFAVFLLLTIGFFYKFGGPVAPNLKRHSWAMTAFVMANAVSYFVVSSHIFWLANILLPVVSLGALMFWILRLTKSGELQPVTAEDPEKFASAEAMNVQLQKLADSVTLSSRGVTRKN